MKKTEKIEIRVSYNEKDVLTQLAQAENRSVSEMLRELARKYVLLNKGQSRHLFFRPKILFALSLCFVMGGIIFTQLSSTIKPQPYHISGNIGDTLFGSTVSKFGHSEITTPDHIITIQYSRDWKKEPKMEIRVFQNEPSLPQITMTELRVNNVSPVIWRDINNLGDTFRLMVFNENMEHSEIEKALIAY